MGQSTVPIASMFAALFLCVGTGMFCGTAYVGFKEFYDMFNKTYQEGEGWSTCDVPDNQCENDDLILKKVEKIRNNSQISIFCLSAMMIVLTVYLLFQSFMATAANSKMDSDYTSSRIACGGSGCSLFSLITSFLLSITWIAVFAASVYLFLITFFIYKQGVITPTPISIDFRVYVMFNFAEPLIFQRGNIAVLAKYAESAYIMFVIMMSSAFLVLVGQIILSMGLTANYAKGKSSSKWYKYNEKRRNEERELEAYNNVNMAVSDTTNLAINGY